METREEDRLNVFEISQILDLHVLGTEHKTNEWVSEDQG